MGFVPPSVRLILGLLSKEVKRGVDLDTSEQLRQISCCSLARRVLGDILCRHALLKEACLPRSQTLVI